MLYFGSLLAVMCLSLILIVYINVSDTLVSDAEEDVMVKSQLVSQIISTGMEKHVVTVEQTASLVRIRSMDWDVQQPLLQEEVERHQLAQLGVVTADGIARFNDDTTADIADRDYFQIALRGESNYADPIVSRIDEFNSYTSC